MQDVVLPDPPNPSLLRQFGVREIGALVDETLLSVRERLAVGNIDQARTLISRMAGLRICREMISAKESGGATRTTALHIAPT